MKIMMLSRVKHMSLVKAYCKDMFSFPCSKSLELYPLERQHKEYVLDEQHIAIDRRLRT